jgi:hypothetical protein
MATKKSNKSDNMLNDTARAIGTALGTMSAQADALAAQAKRIHLPSRAAAKSLVSELFSGKKKAATHKSKASGSKRKKPARKSASASRKGK